jgi:hypothetical protein
VTGLTAAQILQVFCDGFANPPMRNVKFTAQFKVAEVKEMAVPGVPSPIQFLSAPVIPPLNPLPGTRSRR